jgi:hypothetical protein
LLDEQTTVNEELREENEKYSKDQASLLNLLFQKDEEIKRTQALKLQSKAISIKVALNTFQKFFCEKSLASGFWRWKVVTLFDKTKHQKFKSYLRLVNEGAIKINRMIERRENEMKKRYFCSCKQEMRNHVKKTQILRKLVGSVDQKKKHEAVKQLKMNLYCKRELQKSKKYFLFVAQVAS